jgi:hypothetical protein
MSIREIAQELDIFSRSVHRVLKENRLHLFQYTRVQHLEPEDYPVRRNFCVWLLNKAADENFISRVLFSNESSFGQQGCFNHRNLHVWSYDNPRAIYPRVFQRRFSVNLWAGLVGDSIIKIVKNKENVYSLFSDRTFSIPCAFNRSTRSSVNKLEDIPLIFGINSGYNLTRHRSISVAMCKVC